MKADLLAYRASDSEQSRIADLFALVPARGACALDIGARDGYLSKRLADRFGRVVALDLERPRIDHPRIECVAGDVTRLAYGDGAFDLVLCAEVLEHIPPDRLAQACAEIARVTRGVAVIGVPYRQDLRACRTTCRACGRTNPSWGHLNRFDESVLDRLFAGMTPVRRSYVGTSTLRTNGVSTWLMDLAGNPFGSWDQEEPCVHCGAPIGEPPPRGPVQRGATRVADLLNRLQATVQRPHANWIHVAFAKREA